MIQESQMTLSLFEKFLGAPMRINLSAKAKSSLASDRTEEITSLIAEVTHRKGRIFETEQLFYWRNESDTEKLHISADLRGSQTALDIRANYSNMAFFIFFAVFFSGMFLTAAVGGFAFQPKTGFGLGTVALVGLIISYFIARLIWGGFAEKRIRELRLLSEYLCKYIDENQKS